MTLDDRLDDCFEAEPAGFFDYDKAKYTILADLLEIIDITVYDITDAPPEFIAGYNEMATATRTMLLQIRSGIEEYCK